MNVVAERSEVRFGAKTIAYVVRRSARRNTVAIGIHPQDGVLVTAPERASIGKLDQLVHAKAGWILLQLRRASERTPAPAPKEFVSGETFLYLGRQHRLRVEADDHPRPLQRREGSLRLQVPRSVGHQHRAAYVRAALIDWYQRRARERIPERVALWSSKLGIEIPPVVPSSPRKRWGSASSSGVVRVNWRVMQAPLSVVDYVVAHELTHLKHPDHSAAFWAALAAVMPNYERDRATLRNLGPGLEW